VCVYLITAMFTGAVVLARWISDMMAMFCGIVLGMEDWLRKGIEFYVRRRRDLKPFWEC
jgi:hypothetical protein